MRDDVYNGGGTSGGSGGGTGAGSPGISSVGNNGGNTNRGLRPLRKDAESRAKAYVIKQMEKSK